MFSVLVIGLSSLRLLRVSGIVMRLRMCLLLITFLKASHAFRNRLLVICKTAYLVATMIMTTVSTPFSCCSVFFFQAEDGIRDYKVTEFRRVLFRSSSKKRLRHKLTTSRRVSKRSAI